MKITRTTLIFLIPTIVTTACNGMTSTATISPTEVMGTAISIVRTEAIRQLKSASEHDILIGGPELAAHALRAGLIDESHLFLIPILVGGGKPALPDNIRLELDLLEERRFPDGRVYLRYHTSQ